MNFTTKVLYAIDAAADAPASLLHPDIETLAGCTSSFDDSFEGEDTSIDPKHQSIRAVLRRGEGLVVGLSGSTGWTYALNESVVSLRRLVSLSVGRVASMHAFARRHIETVRVDNPYVHSLAGLVAG